MGCAKLGPHIDTIMRVAVFDLPNEDDPAVDDVAPSAAAVYDMPCPNDDGWNPA